MCAPWRGAIPGRRRRLDWRRPLGREQLFRLLLLLLQRRLLAQRTGRHGITFGQFQPFANRQHAPLHCLFHCCLGTAECPQGRIELCVWERIRRGWRGRYRREEREEVGLKGRDLCAWAGGGVTATAALSERCGRKRHLGRYQ